MTKESRLTHLDAHGQAHMVDITQKLPSVRQAKACGFVRCSSAIMEALTSNNVPKGDALAVARVAGIAAVKKTPSLLPLAHPIAVHYCSIDLDVADGGVLIECVVRTADRTGIEMEALTGVTVAGLALIDMVKGVDKRVSLENCYVVEKSGGRSGTWKRETTHGHTIPT
ncbi:MAG: cyclic pyranopterin monophosphate synthase MoaC [Actinomycetaceae bacterium]|nr:cyclic pyranopterin monophosphate synthase MoaC [Actinomycetaceae bacterium]